MSPTHGTCHVNRYNMVINRVAMPRKLKNPATSVMVVRNMVEDCAGSWPETVSMMGITAPKIPAITMDRIMDKNITIVSPVEWLQRYTAMPVVRATAIPFHRPALNSLNMTRVHMRG